MTAEREARGPSLCGESQIGARLLLVPDRTSVRRFDLAAAERVSVPVAQGAGVFNTRFSPDGRWIVYDERLSGVGDTRSGGIYVQPFPGPGLRKQVTTSGSYPTWRKDGREIVYVDGDRIWSVRVETTGGEMRTVTPESLFAVRPAPGGVPDVSQLSVSRDGSRFYFPQALEQPDSDVIHVRMGWAK